MSTGVGTFESSTLWAKSKAYMARALHARDHDDALGFHLWAALSLELIGKAALATVNPALVADPSDFGSMLYACGGREPAEKKSITARTAFERLAAIIPAFDEQMKKQCIGIASRRNAELHSGESPMAGLDPRAWVPTFWRCATTIVEGQGRTLDDWVGAEEAARVREIVADASKLLAATVRARIERLGKEFDQRHAPESAERQEAERRAAARTTPHRVLMAADDVEEHECPACRCKGWLLGFEAGEDVDGPHWDRVADFGEFDFGYFGYEYVTAWYDVDGFRCVECGLSIDGRDEVGAAGLPEEFQRDATRESKYEEDYGNE